MNRGERRTYAKLAANSALAPSQRDAAIDLLDSIAKIPSSEGTVADHAMIMAAADPSILKIFTDLFRAALASPAASTKARELVDDHIGNIVADLLAEKEAEFEERVRAEFGRRFEDAVSRVVRDRLDRALVDVLKRLG